MAKRFENNAEIRRLLGDLRSELIPKRVRVNRSLGPSLEMILRPAINFALMRLQRRTQRQIGAFLTCGAWDSLARYLVSVLENALLPTYRIMESATRAAVFAGNWKSDCQRKRCFNRCMSFLRMVKI